MDLDNLVIILLIFMLAIILVAEVNNNKEKEIEILKKTKEYVIYQNCEYFDEEYYCYE